MGGVRCERGTGITLVPGSSGRGPLPPLHYDSDVVSIVAFESFGYNLNV